MSYQNLIWTETDSPVICDILILPPIEKKKKKDQANNKTKQTKKTPGMT